MTYTFAQFIAALAAAKTFSADLQLADQKSIFNEALEQIINSGRWNGTQDTLTVVVNTGGLLTLPRHWQTIIGVKVSTHTSGSPLSGVTGGFVRDLASPWYNFLPGTSDGSQWSTNVIDQGDNHVTFAQPTANVTDPITGDVTVQSVPAQLRIASVGYSGTAEVHGYDQNGAEVYNGTQQGTVLTFNAPKALPYFNIVHELIMPVTPQMKFLYACYDDGTEAIIGQYEPGETVPRLRQYLVNEAVELDPNDLANTIVQARCQRRFVAMVADNDIVPIGNFGAMKAAVRSVHWNNEGDLDRQEKDFNFAIKQLNDELKRQRPPTEIGAMRVWAKNTGAYGIKQMR